MLYPDVALEGSLAAALRAAALKEGFSVPFTASESDLLRHATLPSTVPQRTILEITAWVAERRWSIRGCESFQGMALIDGTTQDLAQVARAAQAWHDGAALTAICRAAPFVHLTGRFEVGDHDPVRLAESEWQHLLTEADEVDWPEYRALVAHRGGRFTLSASIMGDVLVDTITVADAVSTAVRHLPSGLRPVTSGAV
ncbi:hypothetical protein [Streptomyces shenzhenensis]|uniref:hypothetical protein n=1 Tax=Streptomyces shenzhenensis TaxID=943815 RepID=UPI0033D11E3A